MRRLTAVLVVSLALVACGDDDEEVGGSVVDESTETSADGTSSTEPERERERETMAVEDTPAELAYLWEPNLEPGTEVVVVETDAGPMYLAEERRFGFGSCAAMEQVDDDTVAWVCDP